MLDSIGNGKIGYVIKGTKWIINNKDIYNIKIVNISFGTTHNPSNTSELIKNVENMWNEGIIVVAAAGNSGPKPLSITAPGTSRLVITVGSIDDKTFNSGRGPTLDGILKPELVVTGSNITACSNKKNGYTTKTGDRHGHGYGLYNLKKLTDKYNGKIYLDAVNTDQGDYIQFDVIV